MSSIFIPHIFEDWKSRTEGLIDVASVEMAFSCRFSCSSRGKGSILSPFYKTLNPLIWSLSPWPDGLLLELPFLGASHCGGWDLNIWLWWEGLLVPCLITVINAWQKQLKEGEEGGSREERGLIDWFRLMVGECILARWGGHRGRSLRPLLMLAADGNGGYCSCTSP